MIQPKPCTVYELLTQPHHYEIPRFQRGYDWDEEQVAELIDDLKGSKIGLYLGTMIFDESEKDKKGLINIVDGQQRITTLLLFFIAARQAASQLGEAKIAAQTHLLIAFTDPATGETQGPRLRASQTIRDVFDVIAHDDWDGIFPLKIGNKQVKRQVNILKPAYDHIAKTLALNTKHEISELLQALHKVKIIRIDIDQEEEAFGIFERTNARGVDLEVGDLLKNYLYQNNVQDLDEKWNRIMDNSDHTILRMLKYFYASIKGPISKSELYKALKKYASILPNSEVLVDQIQDFSEFYAVVRRETNDQDVCKYFDSIGWTAVSSDQDKYERLSMSLQSLRLFKITQCIPTLYAGLKCIEGTENLTSPSTAKKYISFVRALESYHFLNNAIGGRPGNDVEKIYARYCVEFRSTNSFDLVSQKLLKDLSGTLISEQEFTAKFSTLNYSLGAGGTISLIAYIFDRISNYGLAFGQWVRIFVPDPKVLRKNHNIEHFLPKKQQQGEEVPDADEFVDNIGNLMCISLQVNSSVNNLSPAKKIEKLTTDLAGKIANSTQVKEFITKYGPFAAEWGKDKTAARAVNLAKDSYNRVWKFPS